MSKMRVLGQIKFERAIVFSRMKSIFQSKKPILVAPLVFKQIPFLKHKFMKTCYIHDYLQRDLKLFKLAGIIRELA